jgi:hypothetical protein
VLQVEVVQLGRLGLEDDGRQVLQELEDHGERVLQRAEQLKKWTEKNL